MRAIHSISSSLLDIYDSLNSKWSSYIYIQSQLAHDIREINEISEKFLHLWCVQMQNKYCTKFSTICLPFDMQLDVNWSKIFKLIVFKQQLQQRKKDSMEKITNQNCIWIVNILLIFSKAFQWTREWHGNKPMNNLIRSLRKWVIHVYGKQHFVPFY